MARHFVHGIIMPNLVLLAVTGAEAEAFLDVTSPWEREYLLLNI